MTEPRASRPYMPGYGLLGPTEGSGLLPWSWAEDRLISSRNYWLSTLRSDGSPHTMPVWAVWHGEQLFFSTSRRSRKARNLNRDPRCSVTTEDALNPVILQGSAELILERQALTEFLDRVNAKYDCSYGADLIDPEANSTFRVRPHWAFALWEDDFTGSPTRWTF